MAPTKGSIPEVLESLKSGAAASLKVVFPNNQQVSSPGAFLPRTAASAQPQLAIDHGTTSPTGKFFATMFDLDAPFPSMAFMSPIAHWIQTDLVAAASPGADGFAALSSDQQPVAKFEPPGPPPGSSPHRYVLLVWAQPAGVTYESVCKEVGLAPGAAIGIGARVRWDGDAFEKKLGLGKVVAANFFLSK